MSIDHHSPTTSRHCVTEQAIPAKLLRSMDTTLGPAVQANLAGGVRALYPDLVRTGAAMTPARPA